MFNLFINPVLISLGPLEIRYYGLVYALGFLFAYFYLKHQVKHKKLNMSLELVDTFVIYSIIGGILGGRLGEFLFFSPKILILDPLEIFRVWHGGMSIHGGMLGFIASTSLFCKKYKVKFYELTDHIVIPTSLALFFGRIANFINGELCGRITDVAWAVNLNKPPKCEGYRHPSQLYEALKNLTMFVVLIIHQQKQALKKVYKDGYLTWLFILMYGLLRIITNIWRDDILWFFNILSTGQFISLIMVIIALYVLIKFYWTKKKFKIIKNKKEN